MNTRQKPVATPEQRDALARDRNKRVQERIQEKIDARLTVLKERAQCE